MQMSNPMLDMLSRGAQNHFAGPGNMSGGPMQMMQQFTQFMRMMQSRNPQQMVQNLLSSGQMTHSQFEQLKKQAIELQKILR